ncbi:MAG: hypothetical protein HQ536_01870, partial [Parcubacteria group bacterium]|nr:hypothetical protein [Parcubacteria group bacterium]
TRHGTFLPLKDSCLIIFDDEEDEDFLSVDQKPHYDARTIAALRSTWSGISVIFLSQSPRLENYIYTIKENTFSELNETKSPKNISITDLKSGDYSHISYSLKKAISNALQKHKKVILFLNRKGKASFVSCRGCGFVWKCNECEVPLRAYDRTLWCNRCKNKKEVPTICEKCKGVNIHFSGTGTQKIEQELKKEFPSADVLRIDKDALEDPNIEKADIIIGTEYLYKNYLYPHNQIKNIGLVVLPLADTLFNYPDFRTDEKAFAWIVRFANLSEQESAEMIVQTYSPENQILRLACKNSLDFYKKEIEERKKFGYPPFGGKNL